MHLIDCHMLKLKFTRHHRVHVFDSAAMAVISCNGGFHCFWCDKTSGVCGITLTTSTNLCSLTMFLYLKHVFIALSLLHWNS